MDEGDWLAAFRLNAGLVDAGVVPDVFGEAMARALLETEILETDDQLPA